MISRQRQKQIYLPENRSSVTIIISNKTIMSKILTHEFNYCLSVRKTSKAINLITYSKFRTTLQSLVTKSLIYGGAALIPSEITTTNNWILTETYSLRKPIADNNGINLRVRSAK